MDDLTSVAKACILDKDEDLTAHEEMVADTIALELMDRVREFWKEEDTLSLILEQTETRAVKALGEIAQVLNDRHYSDRDCVYQIDAILSVLGDLGIRTSRHNF